MAALGLSMFLAEIEFTNITHTKRVFYFLSAFWPISWPIFGSARRFGLHDRSILHELDIGRSCSRISLLYAMYFRACSEIWPIFWPIFRPIADPLAKLGSSGANRTVPRVRLQASGRCCSSCLLRDAQFWQLSDSAWLE